ncbi:armadillo repeat-containing protein 8-like isoform X2 [Haliotis rufescens]|uniref:armadillo repeat-containing protein 8-like isoform X2 n=1 Tax=Haliotis rufescens TaxID=6454 RepID=UPI001EAFAE69|nr:armadillo repeat-containing protein 8-like isoform X2 [Haliotis rufescens]
MIPSNMEVDGSKSSMEIIFSEEHDRWTDAVNNVKNLVIGNNKQKSNVIGHGVIPRLLQWMINEASPIELRTECAVVLGSLAKGTDENISALVEAGCVSVLLKGLSNQNLKYVEACLRCLRTIFLCNKAAIELVYQDATIIPHLINIISKSVCTQECITTIFANCCKTPDHQDMLCKNGAIAALAPLLGSDIYKVQMPTLKCFAVLCHQNDAVSQAVASATYNGDPIPKLLIHLLARDKTSEMQMAAAKCMTYLYRGSAIEASNTIITLKTLPTLVRMCKKDRTLEENVEGAENLAYLIEVDPELQRLASISDHVIKTLADYLKYGDVQQIGSRTQRKDIDWGNEMRQAAFKAFASLGANDEDIRKKVIATENLMDHIVVAINSTNMKVQIAATRCLHSLSRSVQQLRTTFQDHAVWKPLLKMMQSGNEEAVAIASSTLCNLLLEFSPSKEPILECGAINILASLASRNEAPLRLNGVWGLMNMAFQADQKVKTQIVETLGSDQLFCLLSDQNPNILMKTLGLLRNLLSNKPVGLKFQKCQHIDSIMNVYGKQVMQAVVFILEGDHSVDVKEQTLCILANIADGDSAKDVIMANEDVLKKLMSYMVHSNVKLQIAATFCISNLVCNEEEGAYNRQTRLRDMGVQKLLQQLLGTQDSTLFDKVKTALQQFS